MERLTERKEINKCPGILVKEGFANEGLQTWFNGYDDGYSAINKCAEYEDLEEQGKLIKLPCAVGDTVYVKMQSGGYAEAEVRDYSYFLSCGFCVVVTSDKFDKQHIPFSEFGKTIFTTRSEAGAKGELKMKRLTAYFDKQYVPEKLTGVSSDTGMINECSREESCVSDETLCRAVAMQNEFMRRYRERYRDESEFDIVILKIMMELQERRAADGGKSNAEEKEQPETE